MKYNNIMVGADPELFLIDSNNNFVSAIDKIGGTKLDPRPIGNGHYVQEDNVAVEFNIAPAKTKGEFVHSIGTVLQYLHEFSRGMGFSLNVIPSAHFPLDQLVDHRAIEFGCDPDYNVWLRGQNPPVMGIAPTLRSAGGHVHVSWDEPKFDDQEEVVMAMDVFCGVPAIQYDKDQERRELYGKAGAFRFKPYGIEYRTLSNFWIKSPDLCEWVYDRTMEAIAFLNGGGKVDRKHRGLIEKGINGGDYDSYVKLQQYYPI